MKLKPTTSYDFSKSDLDFVLEIAKVGHVHLLSNQVSLVVFKEHDSSIGMTFMDYGGGDDKKCIGLQLPDNWYLENIYAQGHHELKGVLKLSLTFKVLKGDG